MSDILLIQPPIQDFYFTKKRSIPYGLACLSSHLHNAGFTVQILDALATNKSRIIPWPKEFQYLQEYYGQHDTTPYALFHTYKEYGLNQNQIRLAIKESNAKLVGITSLFTPYCQQAYDIAKIVREELPHSTIVLGGHHATALPEHVLQNSCADYCIRGEGEESITLLAQKILTISHEKTTLPIQEIKNIPGLCYRNEDNTYIIQDIAILSNYDNPPLPDLSLIDHKFYSRKQGGSAVIVAGRGCPMRCSYCCVSKYTKIPFRQRTIDSILQEIDYAVTTYNARFIDFEDENISFNKSWFHELLNRIIEKYGNTLELRAMNGLYPPSLDNETIQLMAQAGFRELNLALATISPEQLERFQRPDVHIAFENAVNYANSIGLTTVGYIIVGAPNQNAYESLNDLLYLAHLPVLSGVSVYYPSPNSKDYTTCKQLGLLPQHLSLLRSTALPLSHTTTRLQSITLLRLSRIVDFLKTFSENYTAHAIRTEYAMPDNTADSISWGKYLLYRFFRDNILYGKTPSGELFEHKIDQSLSQKFIEQL